MPKIVTLKLTRVKYKGKAIGDDIHIQVQYLNFSFNIDKKMKHGSEIILNQKIGETFVDQNFFNPVINIKVVEDDGIFDDETSKDTEIKVDLNTNTPQITTHEIEVRERRSRSPGPSSAIFSFTIEILVRPDTLYVTSDTTDGWILALSENGNEVISLPSYLKIRLYQINSKREYFTIQEGQLQGVKASVKFDEQGNSYFIKDNLQTEAVTLTYSISKKNLMFEGQSFKTIDNPDSPWEKGTYTIEIPDAPHRGGHTYTNVAQYATVWFPLRYMQSRYLHTGLGSAGCITLTEQNKWDNLCKKLMKARKGDGKNIGVLKVIE